MPIVSIHDAKNKLKALSRKAIAGKEFLLADTEHKGTQPVSLISTALLDELCETKTFSFEWLDNPDEESPYYSLYNTETGVYGLGSTKHEAVSDFIDNIIDYAKVYFKDLPFYLNDTKNRHSHYWYLRRVLRCREDRERLYHLLGLAKLLSD